MGLWADRYGHINHMSRISSTNGNSANGAEGLGMVYAETITQ